MYEISSYMKTFFGSMYEISSYMKTFFGSMYEISLCYDRGFLIDEIMLYLVMYELFHDPYCIGKSSKAGETAFTTSSPTKIIPFKKENKLSNKYVFFNEQGCELFDEKTLFEKHCVSLGVCFLQEMVE